MFIIKHFQKIVLLITSVPIMQIHAQPTSLVLQDTIITTTAVFVASNSITAGPNFTIAGTGDATFSTNGTIYFRSGVVILQGGQLRSINTIIDNVQPILEPVPTEFSLEQNYPNPFNPSTTIRFAVKELSKVKLVVFNLLGEPVTSLVDKELDAGWYEAHFSAPATGGLASGVYFYTISAKSTTGGFLQTKKMILIK